LAACAQQQDDGVAAIDRSPVNGGLDASAAIGPADTGSSMLPPPVMVDSSIRVYRLDAATVGFEDGGCGATAIEAKQVVIKEEKIVEEHIDEVQPVAIYIVLDQSISMVQQGLWTPAKDALKAFVNDAESAGVDVALEFFPADDFDPFLNAVCDGSGLDVPAVAMGRLPMHAANVTQLLDSRVEPIGFGTPIEAALRGAGRFCTGFEQSSMGEECVGVLVTDGAPLGCQQGSNELLQLAQMIYGGGMGTRLFTVGLQGADFTLLDALAQAGGAVDCDMNSDRFACDVSGGPNQLAEALQKIRSVVTTVKTRVETTTRVQDVPVECEWTIPPPPPGEAFDRSRVNVRVSAPSLAAPIDFGQVPNASACMEKGWHYDNPSAPTRLIACPQTCSQLSGISQAKVDVLLGCETIALR
jgi:Mg-chelatase subunit ChlD